MARVNIKHVIAREYAREWADDNHVKPLADQIQNAAQREAPIRTGTLRATIYNRREVLPLKITRRVGSPLNYSYLVHGGARPHRIVPRSPNGRLVFFWKKVGRIVSLRQVNHPGFKGVPYLQRPLVIYGNLHRFRVILYPQAG